MFQRYQSEEGRRVLCLKGVLTIIKFPLAIFEDEVISQSQEVPHDVFFLGSSTCTCNFSPENSRTQFLGVLGTCQVEYTKHFEGGEVPTALHGGKLHCTCTPNKTKVALLEFLEQEEVAGAPPFVTGKTWRLLHGRWSKMTMTERLGLALRETWQHTITLDSEKNAPRWQKRRRSDQHWSIQFGPSQFV